MKKILFGITGLTLGGAERVLVDIANKLSNQYDITIFTLYGKGEFEKSLNKKVKLKSLYNNRYDELNKIKKILIPIKILLFKESIYRKFVQDDYDVEIAFLEGPITRLFSTNNSKTKKIAWIHNDIDKVYGEGIKSKLKKKLDERIYNKYNDLVFVSKDNLEIFKKVYSRNKSNKSVIYNYIDKDNVIEKSDEGQAIEIDSADMSIVTVARLTEQKAIDRFIRVHSKLIKEGIKHNVYIIGDGPEKENLQKLIKEENVENTFKLLGKRENPYTYIKSADYFALLSNFEGYGMVLEEAKILNKNVVITDTAAREAVRDYPNAHILENTEEGIYNGLRKILINDNLLNSNDEYKYDNDYIIEDLKRKLEE